MGCHFLSRDLPDPGIKLAPALAGVFFTTEPPGKPKYITSYLEVAKLHSEDTDTHTPTIFIPGVWINIPFIYVLNLLCTEDLLKQKL